MAAKNDLPDSIIGEGSVFEGRFHVEGSLQIDGKFEGEVKIDDQLTVGEAGKVKTNVFARRVVIHGTFIGNIEATEEVIITGNGKVLGEVTSPIINVGKDAIVHGQINITSNKYDKVGIQQIIEETFSSGPSIPPQPVNPPVKAPQEN